MPSLLSARPPQDPAEERAVGKLAASRHAPGDWIARARMITRSWDGARTSQIAAELHCHPQTVRERIKRFNAEGWTGLVTAPVPAASPGGAVALGRPGHTEAATSAVDQIATASSSNAVTTRRVASSSTASS